MTATDKILEAVESIDVNSIDCEESVKLRLILLVNAVEALAQEIRKQRDEIEYLKTLYNSTLVTWHRCDVPRACVQNFCDNRRHIRGDLSRIIAKI